VNQDERRLYLATLFLFTLPGPPVLLSGTEALVTHHEDATNHFELCRQPIPWANGTAVTIIARNNRFF
jgi:glycosidase